MNKIFIEDLTSKKDLYFEESAIVIVKNSNCKLNYFIKDEINVFTLIMSSKAFVSCKVECNSSFNMFSFNSSLDVKIDILKDNINYRYAYSTLNKDDNDYQIDINHLGNNIKSNITNHGINTDNNKLSFVINTVVPKNSININTNQDSKIIVLKDNNASIKPNLLIDNDDIEANHSAYIGRFKEEELFYLMTRGIKRDDAVDLMIKSFLIGNMKINSEEKELILNTIKEYWR